MLDPEQTRKRLIVSYGVLNEMAGLTEVLNNSVDSSLKSFIDPPRIVAEVHVRVWQRLE